MAKRTAAARTPRKTKAQQARDAEAAAQPSRGAGAQSTKAQSEIGPITYREGAEPLLHGADDPETQDAYALGHPSQSTIKRTPRQAASVAGPGVGESAPDETDDTDEE